jgi:hypothetical protein
MGEYTMSSVGLAHVNTVVQGEPAPPDPPPLEPPLEVDDPLLGLVAVDEHEAAPATAQQAPARRPSVAA